MEDKDRTKTQLIKELSRLRQQVAELRATEDERCQTAEALRQSLKEAEHSRKLLLALSQAARAVQRARTAEAVYHAIGEQAARLGLDATVLTLCEDEYLSIAYMTLKSALLQTAEKLTGLSAKKYRIPLTSGGYFQRIIASGETVFSHLDATLFIEALPPPVRPLAGRLVDLFDWKQSVIAPLSIGDATHGLLIVTGTDLTKSDVPAITAFADQAATAIENARLYKEAQQLVAFNESIIQSMTEGIVVQDAEGFFTFVNPAAETLLGYTAAECESLHWTDIIPPDQQPLVYEADERRKRGEADRYELELVRQDGQRVPILVSGSPRFDVGGQFMGTLAVFTDITERKQAEEEVRKFKRALDSSSDAVGMATPTGRHYYQNRTFEEIFGDLENESPVSPYVDETVGRDVLETIMGGDEWTGEVAMYRKDGEVLNILLRAYPIKKDGDMVALVGIHTDITERKRAEDALRESERQYRELFENSRDGFVVVDIEGRFVDANQAYCHMLGYTLAELRQKEDFYEITPARWRAWEHEEIWERRLLQEGYSGIYEKEYIRKDGTIFPVELQSYTVLDEVGQLQYLWGVARDITERKRAEEALRNSREQLTLITDNIPLLIGYVDAEQRYLYVNQAYADWYGKSKEELIGKHLKDVVYEASYLRMVKHIEAVLQGEELVFENVSYDLDGQLRAVRVSYIPHFDEEGYVKAFFGLVQDITEQKQAEESLRKSEERYRVLADNSADLIWICGMQEENFRMIYINPAVETMLGYTVEEFLQIPIQERMTPESLEVVSKEVAEIERTGQARVFQIQHIHKSGRLVNCELWVKPIYDEEGHLKEYQGRTSDITERKRTERERERLSAQVREQARQMEQILATVPAGVLLLDARGRVLQANPVAEKDLQALAEGNVGDVLTSLGDRSLAELLTSPLTKGLWHEVRSDDKRTFEVIARPMTPTLSLNTESGGGKGHDATREHWVLVINDVTREREVQAQLQQQERLAAVGQLAAGIAHDFNNITATIVLYSKIVAQSSGLSERDQERVAIITQQAWHASQLIEQILDFSRRAVLERQPLDLLPLLKEQVKLLRRTLPENIKIDLSYGVDEYVVNADPTRIQQMLTNLAVNARDAMPNGGTLCIALGRITIADSQSTLPAMVLRQTQDIKAGDWIQLTVSDTGTGIAPDVLPHIFEPFFTTKGPGEGSGLGLAQVHGIVGLHEGHIDVDTQMGEGTTFTIHLPALAVQAHEPTSSDLPADFQGQGEIVLVVEDDVALRTALTEILELLNYQTLEAADGQDALAILETQREHIALVLSDVVMPTMGGIALFHALREKGWQIPLILLTGHPMDKELDDLQAQGVSAWLTKPPSIERLGQALSNALNT